MLEILINFWRIKRREQPSTYYLLQYTVIFCNMYTFLNCLKKLRQSIKTFYHAQGLEALNILNLYTYMYTHTHSSNPQMITVKIEGRPMQERKRLQDYKPKEGMVTIIGHIIGLLATWKRRQSRNIVKLQGNILLHQKSDNFLNTKL